MSPSKVIRQAHQLALRYQYHINNMITFGDFILTKWVRWPRIVQWPH